MSIVGPNSPCLTTAMFGPTYTAPGVATGGTSTYGGGEQTSYGIGLNWYPNLNMKFMLDYGIPPPSTALPDAVWE